MTISLETQLKVKDLLFEAFSNFDIVDVCDMINYRGGIVKKAFESQQQHTDGYLLNISNYITKTEVETLELAQYVKAMCDKCFERLLTEFDEEFGVEYYCQYTNICVSITKELDVASIEYTPVSGVS